MEVGYPGANAAQQPFRGSRSIHPKREGCEDPHRVLLLLWQLTLLRHDFLTIPKPGFPGRLANGFHSRCCGGVSAVAASHRLWVGAR